MDILNSKNKIIAFTILILIGCKRNYTCKEYVLSYNYTTIKMKNINKNDIKKSSFFVKRNNKIINKGHLEVVEKLSNNTLLIKLKFATEDTIYKTDTTFIKLKNKLHFITDSKEVCMESIGTPYVTVYKFDGTEFTEDEEIYLSP
ncbi:hypothetical protein [Flavobacterium sp. KACC 22763]|uniref:hypothetical protein n=1 Tax=Flavobacterium sp. KACC 22763 TaxID=3025668 RepID=UPI0023666863|nr:hypothetical protein [Flavobacterium sp. KACC 22763]WDF66405.1 hypothetical protein PQ463_09575 [Flavobacterium sp. KACC 22763]